VKSIAARFFLPLASVTLSLISGAVVLGLFWYHFPDTTLQLFKWAGSVREAVFTGYWPGRYEAVSRGLVDERLIVYMGFVVATRVLLGILMLPVYRRIDRKPRSEFRL